MKIPQLGLLLALVAGMTTAAFDQTWFDGQKAAGFDRYKKDLSIGGKAAHLFWKITTDKKLKMRFEVESANLGWLGIGIGEAGGMKGADIFIGAKSANGDFFGTRNGAPTLDCKQDWTQTKYEDTGSKTVVEAERLLNTGDVDHDREIEDDSNNYTPILLAYGTTAWTDSKTAPAYHGTNKVKGHLRFFGTQKTTSDFDAAKSGAKLLNFKASNYAIPTAATTYHNFCFPKANMPSTLMNIIAIEPVIDKTAHVHHFVLSLSSTEDCDSGTTTPVWAWAPGAYDWAAPAGTAIKASGSSNTKNFHLQIHYDNPTQKASEVDSSGVILHYKDTGTFESIGMLQIGDGAVKLKDDANMKKIPEGITSYFFEATIPGSKTFNVIGDGLHMHKHGEKMITEHFTGNTKNHVSKVVHYDFPQQGNYDAFKKKYTIKGGDRVTIKCTYKVPAGKTVNFGIGSDDEMCINFVMYYPEDTSLCGRSYCGLNSAGKFSKDVVKKTETEAEIAWKDAGTKCGGGGGGGGGQDHSSAREQAPMRVSTSFAAFVVGVLFFII